MRTFILSFFQDIRVQNQGSRPDNAGLFNNPTVLLLLVGIVILLAGLLIVLIFLTYRYLKRERKVEILEKTEEEESTLIKEEKFQPSISSSHWERLSLEDKYIVKILSENQGNILQKELPSLTDYSKSTITRIMTRLEEQDLIYRTPAGRGYRVFLKEEN